MKKTLLLVAALTMFAVPQVFAQDNAVNPSMIPYRPYQDMHRPHHPKAQCFDILKYSDQLKLTDEQKIQIETIKTKNRELAKPIKEEINAKRQEMKAVFDEKLTAQERQEKLAPIGEEMKKLRAKMFEIRKEGKKEIEKVLTPAQFKKWEKIKQDVLKKSKSQDFPKCGCKKGMPSVKPPFEEK